jgi:hypothetical protein
MSTNSYFKVTADCEVQPIGVKDGEHVARLVPRSKLLPRMFFFDDRRLADTERAFDLAKKALEQDEHLRVAVYRAPLQPGPWDDIAIVGHRRLSEVRADSARAYEKIAQAKDKTIKDSWAKTAEHLREERDQIETLYAERRGTVFADEELEN